MEIYNNLVKDSFSRYDFGKKHLTSKYDMSDIPNLEYEDFKEEDIEILKSELPASEYRINTNRDNKCKIIVIDINNQSSVVRNLGDYCYALSRPLYDGTNFQYLESFDGLESLINTRFIN